MDIQKLIKKLERCRADIDEIINCITLDEDKKKPVKKSTKGESVEFKQLAKYLETKIVAANDGDTRFEADNINKWAKELRLMVEADKWAKKEITDMIDYVTRSDNMFRVESAGNLRKKAKSIMASMKAKQLPTKQSNNSKINFEYF